MTSTAIASKPSLRASHRRVLQLFRTFGPMSHQEAYEVAIAEGWVIAPSALRSRINEVCPPKGAGIRDSGQRRKSQFGGSAIIWELDPTVSEPFAHRREGRDK